MMPGREKIAIVGSGISGMACAHFLHPFHDITLFEKDDRIGGHSNTVNAGNDPLDTGFMVYNEVTYPLLTRLFRDPRRCDQTNLNVIQRAAHRQSA